MQKTTQEEIRSPHPRRIDDKKRLIEQKSTLDQKDLAIREVLRQIERGREEIKSNVAANVENLLMPILQKLELKGESYYYIQLLRNNLKELTSSLGLRLADKEANLTPKEIEICNMLRNGLTNKEVSALLNISSRTIEKHRSNIRKKLSIDKDNNLLSFLKTL
ncbi:MAG: helix-turn-helix transcriptional regulator [Candidatus Brocadiaceae bacterium]|nr:helix-turn-helix transcriptional regulator [Candidatus Brocadiaceae bacterium]